VRSNPVHSGNATNNPATAPINANHRAMAAFLSEPLSSTTAPARIGSQITVDNGANPIIFSLSLHQIFRNHHVISTNTPIIIMKA
jgi:hypothetical protein